MRDSSVGPVAFPLTPDGSMRSIVENSRGRLLPPVLLLIALAAAPAAAQTTAPDPLPVLQAAVEHVRPQFPTGEIGIYIDHIVFIEREGVMQERRWPGLPPETVTRQLAVAIGARAMRSREAMPTCYVGRESADCIAGRLVVPLPRRQEDGSAIVTVLLETDGASHQRTWELLLERQSDSVDWRVVRVLSDRTVRI